MGKERYKYLGTICEVIDINDFNNINLIIETSVYGYAYIEKLKLYNFTFLSPYNQCDIINIIDYIISYSSNPCEVLDLFIPVLIKYKFKIFQYWKDDNPLYDYLRSQGVNVAIWAHDYTCWDALKSFIMHI